MLCLSISSNAQSHTKKDGTPDMRYRENKDLYGSTSPSYTPSKSQPNNTNYSPSNYDPPKSTFPTYPTKQDGTPDMRYKENKDLYGLPE